MTYGKAAVTKPAQTAIAELAETVADEGWSVVGVLDEALSGRLLRAVDEVAERSREVGATGQLHQLSGLSQHPDLVSIVDWPPLLALAVEIGVGRQSSLDGSPHEGLVQRMPVAGIGDM